MPWEIRKDGEQYCLHKKDGGKRIACHPTEEEAKRHMAALYANVPEAQEAQPASKTDYVIAFGGAVKALGEGRVGGYVVRYGGPEDADGDGEWFTPETDFDTEFPARASIYYNHGLDPVVGRRRLAHGAMKLDDVGVWVEAQLDLQNQYQSAMYRMAKAGKLGWSSGSLSHITDPPREAPGGAIKSWPLGHDASLTPIPSDRRNLAIALKSWEPPPLEELSGDPGDLPPSLAEDLDRVADHAERVKVRCAGIKAGTYQFSQSRRERIARLRDELSALLDETAPRSGTLEPVTDGIAASPPPGPGEGGAIETVPPASPAGALLDVNALYARALQQEGLGLTQTGST